MNGLYTILLFLFIFGVVAQGVNEMGVFDYTMPYTGAQIDNGTIDTLQSGALGTDLNPWNTVMIFISFMRVIGAGVLAMFWVAPIISQYFTMAGADGTWAMIIATMLQAPLTFVTLFGLYEWWTGRTVT
jgi:hypothetical protein